MGISEEELDSEMEKIALADKYQSIYAEMNQKEYEAYNFNGEAYEALLSEHKYSVNEKYGTEWILALSRLIIRK